MRITLDSNILVYSLQEEDPRNERAVSLIDRASQADCVQTVQSFGESFRVLTRRRLFAVEEAIESLRRLRSLFLVVAASVEDFDQAISAVRDHKLPFWDAMLWATARRAGCRLLVTEDGHDGLNLGGVRFVNPFIASNRDLLDLALPYEESPR